MLMSWCNSKDKTFLFPSIASGDSLDNNQVLDDGRAKEDDEQEITVNFFDEKQQIRYGNNALGEVLRQYDFIDEEMGTRGHDLGDSASSSSEQGESKSQGKLVVGRRQSLGDLDHLESTEIWKVSLINELKWKDPRQQKHTCRNTLCVPKWHWNILWRYFAVCTLSFYVI